MYNVYIYDVHFVLSCFHLIVHLLGLLNEKKKHKAVFCFFSRSDASNFKLIAMFTL